MVLGYVNLDKAQLQLRQPSQGEASQHRYLEERGEGVFQVGFSVPDYDES